MIQTEEAHTIGHIKEMRECSELLSFANCKGLEVIINHDDSGYGIENILVNGKCVGSPRAGGLFKLITGGLQPEEIDVRLDALHELRTDDSIRMEFSGRVIRSFAEIDLLFVINIYNDRNCIDFILSYTSDHDVAGYMEFAFGGDALHPQWEANIYPWAENSTSLPEIGLDDAMNRHLMTPSLRYKDHIFYYAGIPAVLIRKPDRSMACLFGVHKDFKYGSPSYTDWQGGVNMELEPSRAIKIVSDVKGGYIRGGIQYEVPMQLIISDNDDKYYQTYDLLENWCEINNYTAHPIPCKNFKDEKETLDFLIARRRDTEFFFEDATYATDLHRFEIFGTYPANTGFNIYLDLFLGLEQNDEFWFKRAATQIKWLARMQIRRPGDVGDGLFCPVIPEGKHPGFYLHKEYEIEVNSLGAYWLIQALIMMRKNSSCEHMRLLPELAFVETLAFNILNGVRRHQQSDGAIPQKVTDGGQYAEAVTPAHTLNAFYAAWKYTGDTKWQKSVDLLEQWTIDNCIEPLYFIGAHPDLQSKQYEEGSIHNVTRYLMTRYEDSGEPKYLSMSVHLASTAFFWRCPKQIEWVDTPTQGCTSEQTHFPQFSLYSYWCFKYLTHMKIAQASGLKFFDNEARFLVKQAMRAVVTTGPWAGAYCERLADPWNSRCSDPIATSNLYLSELAPEYLYQLYKMTYLKDGPQCKML